jgi:hypothetical protein
VIGAAAGIQAKILPIAEVTIAVGRDAIADSVLGCDAAGTGEALEGELIPLFLCEVALGCEGG